MDDFDTQDHQEELSKGDLEVLRAFHALEFSTPDDSFPHQTTPGASLIDQSNTDQSAAFLSEDDMLALFATEADEEIAAMRLAVKQLEQDNRLDSRGLKALKRGAHKVAGTAAAIGCASMSTIARHIETIIKLMEDESLAIQTGLIALLNAMQALEATLHSLLSNGFESKNPLLQLEEEYKRLNIDVHVVQNAQISLSEAIDVTSTQWFTQQTGVRDPNSTSLRIDAHHFNKLLESAENFIELDIPMEHAQKQVEIALNDLQFAQSRLRRLEPLLSSLTLSVNATPDTLVEDAGYPPSSLVARILQEASIRTSHVPQQKNVARPQPLLSYEAALWDEMEIDRFSETNVLTHSLTEAITDVALATTHLRQALTHLKSIVVQQVIQASTVRNEVFLLRSLPFNFLVTRLRAAIEMIAGAHSERIQFEISGESVEINQDVLEKLADPLLELVQMQVAEVLFFTQRSEQDTDQSLHIGFNAHSTGNEITIEISFSQSVPSGAIALLQDTVHQLYGSVTLQEKGTGKITLQLRLPRSQRMIQGLLVRAGSQQVIVSVSQVKRIHFNKLGINGQTVQARNSQDTFLIGTDEIYELNTLLGLKAHKHTVEKALQTALILELDNPSTAIEVDEVVKEVELVMKPLSEYLCRPGITNTAIDANGNVLLVLNLPEMIRQKEMYQQVGKTSIEVDIESDHEQPMLQSGPKVCHKILIADDSIYIRQSLNMNLSHEGYAVIEAVDGLQALDQLSKESPDLLLLDFEMPNLNGYDVLSIIRSHQEFSTLKIIMLTSRSSEKHKLRASELGANAYLTKPCPQDELLKTIKSLFGDKDGRT
ncbi:MAG TPA: response regulator [Ktedonobacteraceae bacterium]|nr:response regulator [Ktedonobacteraceae bacterium]